MIYDTDVLSLFSSKVCKYFSGSCSLGKCHLMRKNKEKIATGCDFLISLNYEARRKHMKIISLSSDSISFSPIEYGGSENLAQQFSEESDYNSPPFLKFVESLIDVSSSWPLRITKCSVLNERLFLYFDRAHTFQTLISCIVLQGPLYGRLHGDAKRIVLTADNALEDDWTTNMTDFRVSLVRNVLKNMLTESGNIVCQEYGSGNEVHFHVSSKSFPEDSFNGVLICCEAVVDGLKKCKEKEKTMNDYLRQRCEELRTMSRHKHGKIVDSDSWDSYFLKIGKAAVQIEMLSVRPSRALTLSFHQDCFQNHRSAPFILYNCARLATLQEQFKRKCSENAYPSLIPLDEIDFSLLVKEDEWELLTSYLLLYPRIFQNAMEHLNEGKPLPNLICQFLYSLCGCYSSYYRRVRILTEPREQLLPVMFARIYLLQAVEIVLHNGLRLLGVEPVQHM